MNWRRLREVLASGGLVLLFDHMGDYPASDLRRPTGMYPHHEDRPCAGCGKVPDDAHGCYADARYIWHSTCWPKVVYTNAAATDVEIARGMGYEGTTEEPKA